MCALLQNFWQSSKLISSRLMCAQFDYKISSFWPLFLSQMVLLLWIVRNSTCFEAVQSKCYFYLVQKLKSSGCHVIGIKALSLLVFFPFVRYSILMMVRKKREEQNQQNFLFVFFDRLEITSRMAPQAIFKAWRPMFNEDTSTIIYGYDEQLVSVNLEDRTLVSLRFMSSVISRKIFQFFFFFLNSRSSWN